MMGLFGLTSFLSSSSSGAAKLSGRNSPAQGTLHYMQSVIRMQPEVLA